jgi:hypothetical protein
MILLRERVKKCTSVYFLWDHKEPERGFFAPSSQGFLCGETFTIFLLSIKTFSI